jgi:hypothetical protein
MFPEKEYRGLSPNFHIHVSVSELYIPTMGLPFLLEEICGPILKIYHVCPYPGDIFTIKKLSATIFTVSVVLLKNYN